MDSIDVRDPRFASFVMFNAPLVRLATGFDWAEGPVWFGDMNRLLFSDIPNDRVLSWTPSGVREGTLSTFRSPSRFANGHTRDREGRLVSCEHGSRSVTRTEHDGTVTTLADSYRGRRLNSPNDVVVASDGAVWFTDPHYGIATDYEGVRAEQEQPCHVYRLDPSGTLDAVITDMGCPNGLAFSPDESVLYVADTGRIGRDDRQAIRAYPVDGARVREGREFHKVEVGASDGFRLDSDGNLWTSAGDGVHCVSPEGELMGKVLVPEIVSNVAWGGRGGHRLFITATTSLYAISLNRRGARRP